MPAVAQPQTPPDLADRRAPARFSPKLGLSADYLKILEAALRNRTERPS